MKKIQNKIISMKEYLIRVNIVCSYDYGVRANSYENAKKKLHLMEERAKDEFADGNTEYAVTSSILSEGKIGKYVASVSKK